MEFRVLQSLGAAAIEERGEGQTPLIVGYAARYYDPLLSGTEYIFDGYRETIRERIQPGAFNRAVAGQDVVALFNHDPNIVLGRKSAGTMRLIADKLGLRYEIDPPAASLVTELIRRGDVQGSSFSFSVPTGGQTWRDEEIDGKKFTIRELSDVNLFDVGPVVFPAYGATTTGVRAAGDIEEARKACEAWRAAQKPAGDYRTRAMVDVRLAEISAPGLTFRN